MIHLTISVSVINVLNTRDFAWLIPNGSPLLCVMMLNSNYIHTYILPLHKAGKVFTQKSILHRIKTRLNQDFDIIGEDAVLAIVQQVLGHGY